MATWLPMLAPVPVDESRNARLNAFVRTILMVLSTYWPRLGPLIGPTIHYIERAKRRLISLLDRLEAGTWRPCRPSKPRPDRVRAQRDRVRLPTRLAWLNNLYGPELRVYSVWVERLLNEPETRALLAQAPAQAARILRPLARMLFIRIEAQPPPPRRAAGGGHRRSCRCPVATTSSFALSPSTAIKVTRRCLKMW